MIKRRNFVSNVMEHMEKKAWSDGIETQNDVDTIHRHVHIYIHTYTYVYVQMYI